MRSQMSMRDMHKRLATRRCVCGGTVVIAEHAHEDLDRDTGQRPKRFRGLDPLMLHTTATRLAVHCYHCQWGKPIVGARYNDVPRAKSISARP